MKTDAKNPNIILSNFKTLFGVYFQNVPSHQSVNLQAKGYVIKGQEFIFDVIKM